MVTKLTTCGLLVAAMLLACGPVQGQSMQSAASSQMQGTALGKTAFEAMPATRMDLPQEIEVDTPAEQGFSAARFASTIIEILASQNTVRIDGMPSARMDAYLRPPQDDNGNTGLFSQAKSLYDNATSITSRRAEVKIDPLNMRCAVRIKLNALLSK